MTTLLAFVTVAAFGTWIPLAQLLPGVPQRSRIFYVAAGNLLVAAIALLAGGGRLELGWRPNRAGRPPQHAAACYGRARQGFCGEVTSFQHSGPQYPRR